MNINLSDEVTLKDLFDDVDSWSNLPVNSLSEQQLNMIQLKNSVFNSEAATKAGGSGYSGACFICYTGA
ncbi:hypothetical protein [Finegoldia magna]|uniref:hypothetical protein n=1 Tax=Finegoldia magna TaxID=1260 RepID=UPI00290860B0|nr:hypothetical protein [Finegoldia magna]MDU6599205.1 hypothetical protein [Finegoldia magna]